MGYSPDLPVGTKSIRSQADIEDYIANINADNYAGYTAYYSKDVVFKFSSHPDRTLEEFLDWVDQVHSVVSETLDLKRVIIDRDGTRVAAQVHGQFRGKGNTEIENLDGRWGPVWPGNGPTVKMFVWYTLDENGHITELIEDAYLIQKASRAGTAAVGSQN